MVLVSAKSFEIEPKNSRFDRNTSPKHAKFCRNTDRTFIIVSI
jgi:hypothetical protein